MLYFCTLFNKNYFSRGIALYDSLTTHCKAFHLYVFAFDDITFSTLKALNLPNLTPVSLQEFEDEGLLSVKSQRTAAEYCWTSTASTILYSITKFDLPNCTYLDADLFFFSDPAILIEEAKGNSVIITEHRYTKDYDQKEESGTYCVQFMYFKNDTNGLKVLNWWRDRCIEWCFARVEKGKFGDQMYLEDWTTRFEGVHVMQHLGGGLAPWNVQQYRFETKNEVLIGIEKKSQTQFRAVFYHFHRLKFFNNDWIEYTDETYRLSKNVNMLVYEPYISTLETVSLNFGNQVSFDMHGTSSGIPQKPFTLVNAIKYYFSDLYAAFRLILGREIWARSYHSHTHQLKNNGKHH